VISPLGGMEHEINGRGGFGGRLRRNVIDNRLVRHAAGVTAMNDAEEHDLKQDAMNERISMLPLGLDMTEYELGNAGAPCSQRMILILARVHPDEGYVPFLKAFSELGEDATGWTVVIAGRPIEDWRQQLEAAVSRKGGADRIRFAEAPDEAIQKQWLAKASILVAPNLHIRCGVSVMQAVAAGVPAMATHCVTPTTRDDVVRVCAPTRGDMKLALRALIKLSDEQRIVLAERAREEASKLFDWPVLAERYMSLYTNATKRVAS
jgi:glycosyltransferase involved in cell wall biosynthesis